MSDSPIEICDVDTTDDRTSSEKERLSNTDGDGAGAVQDRVRCKLGGYMTIARNINYYMGDCISVPQSDRG